jgi:hypothetical protein
MKTLKYISKTLLRELRTISFIVKVIGLIILPWLFKVAASYFGQEPLPTGGYIAVTIWLVTFVILWVIAKKASELEEPKLAITTDRTQRLSTSYYCISTENSAPPPQFIDCYETVIGIKNISALPVYGVKVQLTRIFFKNGTNDPRLESRLPFNLRIENNNHSCVSCTINPNATEIFKVSGVDFNKLSNIEICFSGENSPCIAKLISIDELLKSKP